MPEAGRRKQTLMANTMVLQDVQVGERVTVYIFQVSLTGSYVQAGSGGEVLAPNSATNPNRLPKAAATEYVRGYPLQGPAGNGCQILPGTDSTHWIMKLWSAANTEVLAAAYNAAITADTNFLVAFEARNYK